MYFFLNYFKSQWVAKLTVFSHVHLGESVILSDTTEPFWMARLHQGL